VTVRRAFTIAEATLSMLIVALMLSTAIGVASGGARTRASVMRRAIGTALADALIDEIRRQTYKEAGTAALGPDGEENPLNRSTFDDVDDYHMLHDEPIRDRTGNAIAGLSGWSRSVRVQWVDIADAATPALSDTGLKRITVTVSYAGTEIVRRTTLRSSAR
jgi:type II secretory pathway pseudopilin PulG